MSMLPALLLTNCIFALSIHAPQSLRAHAQRYGGTAENSIIVEYPVLRPGELVSTSDVVVDARITDVRPHLSEDESIVQTDYTIEPIRFFKRDNRLVTSAKPGATTPLRVRREGGSVTEGEYKYSTIVTGYSASEEFVVGEEVVLFLRYAVDSQYYFNGGPFGAFRIKAGEVHAMTEAAASRRGDSPMPISAFFQVIEHGVPR